MTTAHRQCCKNCAAAPSAEFARLRPSRRSPLAASPFQFGFLLPRAFNVLNFLYSEFSNRRHGLHVRRWYGLPLTRSTPPRWLGVDAVDEVWRLLTVNPAGRGVGTAHRESRPPQSCRLLPCRAGQRRINLVLIKNGSNLNNQWLTSITLLTYWLTYLNPLHQMVN